MDFLLNEQKQIQEIIDFWTTVVDPQSGDSDEYQCIMRPNPTSATDQVHEWVETPEEVLEAYDSRFEFVFIKYTYERISARLLINEPGKMVPESPKATIRVDPRYFKPGVVRDHDVAKAVDDLVDLAVTMHTGIDSLYTYGLGPDGPFTHPTRDDLGRGRVRAEAIHWLNVLPESLVTKLGRDRVLETPAWQVTELDTGGVLLVAYENPVRPDDDLAALPDEIASVVTHLGLD